MLLDVLTERSVIMLMLYFQELVAFGLSTIVSSFFSSPAPSASLSRSLVQERVGGKTQVNTTVKKHHIRTRFHTIPPLIRPT